MNCTQYQDSETGELIIFGDRETEAECAWVAAHPAAVLVFSGPIPLPIWLIDATVRDLVESV